MDCEGGQERRDVAGMINPRPVPIPKGHGIYQIKNRLNGKSYVGSATSLRRRRTAHVCYLNRGDHHSEHLQRAWNKNGAAAFEFIILEIVEKRDDLVPREQFYIDTLKPEYNNCPIAGTNRGRKLSPEHREKLLAASRGRVVSPETREKIRQSLLGRPSPRPEGWGERVRQMRLGMKHTAATKEKIRQTKLRQYKEHPELIEKLRTSHLGHKNSPESRLKQSISIKRYWAENPEKHPGLGHKKSPETIAKFSASLKLTWKRRKEEGWKPKSQTDSFA